LHQELAAKQKTARPSGSAVCHFSGGDFLFGEFPHRTSAGIFIPALGTVALHCPVARLIFGVVPDVAKMVVQASDLCNPISSAILIAMISLTLGRFGLRVAPSICG
jgi:hypothetical protein